MKDNNVKNNVSVFDKDVSQKGSYEYTGDRLSATFANERLSRAVTNIYPLQGKRLIDLGCGDGTYSLGLVQSGAAFVLGIDPSPAAIASAQLKAAEHGLEDRLTFQTGNIYELSVEENFDCIVLRGVLHHLPDARSALAAVAPLAPHILIVEPNGANPVVKLIEKTSRYHIEHEEQSFLFSTIKGWLEQAGMRTVRCDYVNLVPMFCPDWMAKVCRAVEPLAESIPLVKTLTCGQYVILASR